MLWRSCLAAFVVGGFLACSASDDPTGQPTRSSQGGGGPGGQGGVTPPIDAALGGSAGTGNSGAGGAGDSAAAGGSGGDAGLGGTTGFAGESGSGGAGGSAGAGGAAGAGGPAGAGGAAGAGGSGGMSGSDASSGAGGMSGAGGVSTDSGADTGSVSTVGWTLVWSDEFNGPTLDTTAWTARDLPVTVNDELEYYSPNNVTFENGALVLEAREEQKSGRTYTSGKIDTQGKKTWTYGLFVARMRLPATVAMWPAFWLLGVGSWPAAGELDIMEAKGRVADNIGGTAHWSAGGHQMSSGNYKFPTGQDITGWHEYALDWSSTELKWSVDGNVFKTFPWQKPFDNKFFLLLNLAVGGMFDGGKTPPANMTPQRVLIDYVRVYQKT
jgi:hypothetical protein